jgi:hypothetical protein
MTPSQSLLAFDVFDHDVDQLARGNALKGFDSGSRVSDDRDFGTRFRIDGTDLDRIAVANKFEKNGVETDLFSSGHLAPVVGHHNGKDKDTVGYCTHLSTGGDLRQAPKAGRSGILIRFTLSKRKTLDQYTLVVVFEAPPGIRRSGSAAPGFPCSDRKEGISP